jgi:L-alanine-DL-glutamate epimerase-like enolase superfamily enzyme
MTCPIAHVDAFAVASASDAEEFDPSLETVVVCITDEEGRVGVGEADGPAEALRSLVTMTGSHGWSAGLGENLLGRDPFEIGALNRRMYKAAITHARRGLGIHAISAVDIALHDLAGKQVGRPVYQLLGGAVREQITPYATIYPGLPKDRTLTELMDDNIRRTAKALELGYRAVKVEVMFFDLATDRQIVDCVWAMREVVGDDITLMIDFGYRWSDWRQALWTLRELEDCDLFFAEAVLGHDDLDGHARLAARVDVRVCGAEMATTVHECREWLERGHVDVLQPEPARCGGLTEMRRIADLAELHGAIVVPGNWKTGINAAACMHFQAAHANAPFIEWLSPDLWESRLRRDLVTPEPELCDGAFPLPAEPGLGISLNPEVIAQLSAASTE